MRKLFLATSLVICLGGADGPRNPGAIDGDTFVALGGRHIRLWGIDTPERGTACAGAARRALRTLLKGGEPECAIVSEQPPKGRYRARTVGRCWLRGLDLSDQMVRHGYAYDWPRYSGGAYAQAQTEAKAQARGCLWGKEN
jgi:endonuclease YncB( thermonuclease family)